MKMRHKERRGDGDWGRGFEAGDGGVVGGWCWAQCHHHSVPLLLRCTVLSICWLMFIKMINCVIRFVLIILLRNWCRKNLLVSQDKCLLRLLIRNLDDCLFVIVIFMFMMQLPLSG